MHNYLDSINAPQNDYISNLSLALLHPNATHWGLEKDCSLARQLNQAAEGTGLAFIVFTQAIVSLPGAPFWAILFFTMLLSLGLGSQIGILEGMLCTLFDIDIFKRLRKQYVTGECVCVCVRWYERMKRWRNAKCAPRVMHSFATQCSARWANDHETYACITMKTKQTTTTTNLMEVFNICFLFQFVRLLQLLSAYSVSWLALYSAPVQANTGWKCSIPLLAPLAW